MANYYCLVTSHPNAKTWDRQACAVSVAITPFVHRTIEGVAPVPETRDGGEPDLVSAGSWCGRLHCEPSFYNGDHGIFNRRVDTLAELGQNEREVDAGGVENGGYR